MNEQFSVVLTLYRRPYNLIRQVEAILDQTIRPSEILLFQDKVENEIIEIPSSIKDKFDNIKIATKNVGVWGRFDFARSAKNELIFLFDDDTIPGNKWFENCLNEMKKEEALYGTNGVLMDRPKDYPLKNSFQQIGWNGPNLHTVPVDFVGHCWFFKKKWLDYLFENTENMQAYKICAEDMTFSYKLQQYGIKTLVPPHPMSELQMWGNCILNDTNSHTDKNGLSGNKENLKKYNLAMNELLKSGFIPLVSFNSFKIKRLNSLILLLKRIIWVVKLFSKNKQKLQKIKIVYISKIINRFYNYDKG